MLPQMDELRQYMHPDTFEIFERFMGQFREVIVAYLALKRYVTNDVEEERLQRIALDVD